jgi:preprotein translocase subunit SecD
MRLLAVAILILAVSSCSDSGTVESVDPPQGTAFGIPEGIEPASVDIATKIIAQRLDAAEVTGYRIEVADSALWIAVPEDTPPIVLEMAAADGVVSFRPVLEVLVESPFVSDSEGTIPNGVDPSTGLTIDDDTSSDSYLRDESNLVYHVGPAFASGSDMTGASVDDSLDLWLVRPEFSESGAAAFLEATKAAATYPYDGPRRRIAVVVDGVVVSAPAMAQEVDPTAGVDPADMAITFGPEDEDGLRARVVAAYLRAGPLPFRLTKSDDPALEGATSS